LSCMWHGESRFGKILQELRLLVPRGSRDAAPAGTPAAGTAARSAVAASGARAAAACVDVGIDAIEISHAVGTPAWAKSAPEPPFLPMAEAVRAAVPPDYPLALVNGFRHVSVMQRTLESGVVQLISLCRPLIVEPHLPRMLQAGDVDEAICASCGQCWPNTFGEGIACHNRSVQKRLPARP